jgi:hypothetical protein
MNIANGGFTVTAKITFLENDLYRVEAFDYQSRSKVYDQEHEIDDRFSLERIEDLGQQDLSDIQGDWSSRTYFDDELLTLIIDQQDIEGSDTGGCNYIGTIVGGDAYTLDINVSDCAFSGSYKGALYSTDLDTEFPELYGVIVMDGYAIPIYQRLGW